MATTKNYSSWIFMGAALVAGAGAFWLSHVYLKRQEEKLRTEVIGGAQSMVDVVVATGDLQAGTLVSGQTMALGRLPKAHVTQRFVTADQFADVQGHALVRAKSAGEPLLKDDIGGIFVERFSDLLKPGERAITLEASEINTNSGLLLPGDRVDLYAIVKDTSGTTESNSLVPLLENVHVLAAGPQYLRAQDQKYQTLSSNDARYDVVTVAVAVDDAEKLMLARKAGDIAYALRNSADSALNVTSRMSSGAIGFGGGIGSATMGNPDSAPTYEYFSASEPEGAVRQVSAAGNGTAAAGMGGSGFGGAGAKQLLIQPQPASSAAPGGTGATGGTPSNGTGPGPVPMGTTGGSQAPATKTNGTK